MKGLEQLKYYSVDRLKLHCGFERLAILAAETSEESFEGRLNTSGAEQIFSWFRVLNEVHDAQWDDGDDNTDHLNKYSTEKYTKQQ